MSYYVLKVVFDTKLIINESRKSSKISATTEHAIRDSINNEPHTCDLVEDDIGMLQVDTFTCEGREQIRDDTAIKSSP